MLTQRTTLLAVTRFKYNIHYHVSPQLVQQFNSTSNPLHFSSTTTVIQQQWNSPTYPPTPLENISSPSQTYNTNMLSSNFNPFHHGNNPGFPTELSIPVAVENISFGLVSILAHQIWVVKGLSRCSSPLGIYTYRTPCRVERVKPAPPLPPTPLPRPLLWLIHVLYV